MTPEAERYLAKAGHTLEKAGKMLSAGLTEDAGRTAYLAGYHAAAAFIFEKSGKATRVSTSNLRVYRSTNHVSTWN